MKQLYGGWNVSYNEFHRWIASMLEWPVRCGVFANRLFTATIGARLSHIKHDLHSIKKGMLSVKEYIAKIQNIYALLKVSGSMVSDAKKVEIILAGLLSNFDSIITLALFSTEMLPL
ncbi:hypothetical protein J1N35_015526 [Gossypium stocksii]|uniref:Uncharacterized protein n=1 Tax=Gossypium stocksii TaxID=47602 RepID=A0A9D3VWD4_9ROSI|nr:hypothetical protein J1N35_015526 [Gossypium stocksii]